MEYTLLVKYTVKPDTAAAFVRAVADSGVLDAVRAEDGALIYRYFFDAQQPDTVLLVERRRTRECQQAHMKAPHMQRLKEIKDKFVLSIELI